MIKDRPMPKRLPSRNERGNNKPMKPLVVTRPASAAPNFFRSPSMMSRPADFFVKKDLPFEESSPKKESSGQVVDGDNTIDSDEMPIHSYLKELPGKKQPRQFKMEGRNIFNVKSLNKADFYMYSADVCSPKFSANLDFSNSVVPVR